ncbi:MAG: hypothetical protein ACD_26C00137G0002 [uncultured bacterium]|nr:MAG: hypothetical protein ACD_26C00137G0002 [uncultured bacterium]
MKVKQNIIKGGLIVTWEDVKKTYPAQWVLIEAVNAKTEGEKRIIEQLDIVNNFADDGDRAFQRYIELHKVHKEREYYIYHTSNENLDIGVKRWMGVRL